MTPSPSDPLVHVAAYRPTAELLDQEWPAAQQAAMLTRIQASPATTLASDTMAVRSGRRRVWPAAASLVGVAALALLLITIVLPSGTPGGAPPAAAVALEHLAIAAGNTPADLIQPGQYRHLIATDHQDASSHNEQYCAQNTQSPTAPTAPTATDCLPTRVFQPQIDTVAESWTADDGSSWRHDTINGASRYYAFRAGGDDVNNPSPKFLASLPTDPTALGKYLRAHVSGSTSTDEAVFTAVGDMLRGGYAPPTLRAAAIRTLEATSHITTQTTRDSLGRSAVEVTFIDQANRPDETQSLLFDPNTATILEERTTAPDLQFTATYTDWTVVDSVPADVIAAAGAPQ